MPIDFSKLSKSHAQKIIDPKLIFQSLPKRHEGITYLRDVQSEVLAEWFNKRNNINNIIRMNTGSGKTVVSLLVLQSCLNEGYGPAIYICPDNSIVSQVNNEAVKLGIKTVQDESSRSFLNSEAIFVCNIHKIFNGKSFLGVNETNLKIGTFLIDDAHACALKVEEQITLNFNGKIINNFIALFEESMSSQSCKIDDIKNNDPSVFQEIPYWSWQEKQREVKSIIEKNLNNDEKDFKWPFLKDCLKFCRCIIQGNKVEVEAPAFPIDTLPSFFNAKRKIFLSATISDDNLVKIFDVKLDEIRNSIMPKFANDIGTRMIFAPQQINNEITNEDIIKYAKQKSNEYNVVVIVPSERIANEWKNIGGIIVNSSNITSLINRLKSEHVGLLVLINRYDGLDFPHDACRLLIIHDLPPVLTLSQKCDDKYLHDSKICLKRKIQKIEQGIGRGIRANDDFCLVLLIGYSLSNYLLSNDALSLFSSATRAQMKLSLEISDQVKSSKEELFETMELCLKNDQQFQQTSRDRLVETKYECQISIFTEVVEAFRKAFSKAVINLTDDSTSLFNNLINNNQLNEFEKGLLYQQKSIFLNPSSPSDAQNYQVKAINSNRTLFKPISGATSNNSLKRRSIQQISKAKEYFESKKDQNSIVVEMNSIIEQLNFCPDNFTSFEKAVKDLGNILGFESWKPEDEEGKGPDVCWKSNEISFIIECKSEAFCDEISKDYFNQLSGSINWFKSNYSGDQFIPIIIHPSKKIANNSTPPEEARVINKEKLEKIKDNIRNFSSKLSTLKGENNIKIDKIGEVLKDFKFISGEFKNFYTVEPSKE